MNWLAAVQRSIETPPDEWTVKEWRQAAEILGNVADALSGLLRGKPEQEPAAIPRARQRKPRLGPRAKAVPRREPGRPPTRPERDKREILELFELLKLVETQKQGRRLTDFEVAKSVILAGDRYRGRRQSIKEKVAKALSKDISRWRQK